MVEDTHYNPYKISSPVVDLVSIRLLTIIAVEKGLSMHLLDISSAYLNADLEDNREILYTHQNAMKLVKPLLEAKQISLWDASKRIQLVQPLP